MKEGISGIGRDSLKKEVLYFSSDTHSWGSPPEPSSLCSNVFWNSQTSARLATTREEKWIEVNEEDQGSTTHHNNGQQGVDMGSISAAPCPPNGQRNCQQSCSRVMHLCVERKRTQGAQQKRWSWWKMQSSPPPQFGGFICVPLMNGISSMKPSRSGSQIVKGLTHLFALHTIKLRPLR